jgi:predicted permease
MGVLASAAQDVRYAWRQLRHAPAFTSTAVLTLALGIGVNTAFFSVVNALAFKPVPGVNLDRVFQIGAWEFESVTLGQLRQLELGPPDTATMVAATRVEWPVVVQVPGKAERLPPRMISGSFSRVFGLVAQAGRWISPEDDRESAADVVVISDRLWREWFGAKPDTVGHASVRIKKHPFTVVGVAMPEFRGLQANCPAPDIWLPIAKFALVHTQMLKAPAPDAQAFLGFVKARPGVSQASLQNSLQVFVATPPASPGPPQRPRVLVAADDALRVSGLAGLEGMLLGVSTLILMAACANLANMLYARGSQRAGEMAVRLSLGASTARILRLLVAEVAIIAALSVAAGLAVAYAVVHLFSAAILNFHPSRYSDMSIRLDLSLDHRILLYAFGAGALAALFVGTITAWRSSRVPPLRALASSGAPAGLTTRARGVRTALVAVQVTSALLLLMGAGSFQENMRKALDQVKLLDRHANFDTTHLVTARMNLTLHDYNESRGREFYARLLQDAGRIPGVEHVALADGLPSAASGGTMFAAEDRPGRVGISHRLNADYARVTPGFFSTIDLPLRRGRDFTPADTYGGPLVAIVSEGAATRLWPGEDPIGKRVLFGAVEWLTVVGVSADPVGAFVFVPFAQRYTPNMIVVARSPTPQAVVEPLQSTIRAIDDEIAILEAGSAEESLLAWVRSVRSTTALITSLGALALGIATLGVYGVLSFFVSSRTREFGIRMALGATPGRIVRMVLDQAVHFLLVGLLPGVFIASVGTRLIENQLFKVMPNEISTWIAVPLIILATGMVAGYLPARRAARVDPNVTLREL